VITGQDLRMAREAQGVGLGKLAARIGRSKGHLSKVERGVDHRAVTPALIRDYQRALGVALSETHRVEPVRDDSPATVTEHPAWPGSPVMRAPADARAIVDRTADRSASAVFPERAHSVNADDNVQRRKFLTGAAITGFALVAPQADWLSGTRRIGPDDVRLLTERTARQRRLDDYLGGVDTYQVYAVELEATKKLHREASYQEPVGEALLALIAEQAQQTGWAAFDAGQHPEAERLYRESLSAAQQAGNRSLAGNAFAYLAYQMVSTARPGVDVAARSCETVDSAAPSAVRALMSERLAWAHAVARQPSETERALARAHSALDEDAGEPAPDWAQWVDHDEIQIMTGRCWTELHRPLRAVPVLEQVLSTFDDSHARDKALYLTWLATAYLDANEIEQAAVVTRRAVNLSTGVGSVRPQQRIGPLLDRLEPHRQLPQVRDLLALARG
jgi:transcriptional regulator with XRE-family HTH domain/tetratricopeptide (TPR) repeat protein